MGRVGAKVGNIRLLEVLGGGGMGRVYVGLDETLKRRVAVKSIRPEVRLGAGAKERFLREARVLSELEHPNICRIYDYLEEKTEHFLVLELVEGRTLKTAIGEGLDRRTKLNIALQIADVLAAAHGKNVIHRDLKPDNVMVTPEGNAKILDFGLARRMRREPRAAAQGQELGGSAAALAVGGEEQTVGLPQQRIGDLQTLPLADTVVGATRLGEVIGTPGYMSPEQARGEPLTTASDMYTFGLLLHALFMERPAYEPGLTGAELVQRAREGETLKVEHLDSDLARLIERLKSPQVAERPTAREARKRLETVSEKPRRRLRRLLVAGIATLMLALGLKYTIDLSRERTAALAARDQALASRAEAERARREVEATVDFLVGLFEVSDPGAAQGSRITAREVLDRGAERVRSELAGEPRLAAHLMGTIGSVYRNLGLYAEARQLLEETVAIERRELGESAVRLDAMVDLAWLDMLTGDYEAAVAGLEATLALGEATLPPQDSGLVPILNMLGNVAAEVGEVQAARGHYERALELALATLGPEDVTTARVLANLGTVRIDLGEYAAAEATFQQALPIFERVLGQEHPTVALTFNQLGVAYARMHDYDKARRAFGRALEIRQKVLGDTHADVARSMVNVANVLTDEAELEEARATYEEAAAIAERALGRDHFLFGQIQANLGAVLAELGALQPAEERLRLAIEVAEQSVGRAHPETARFQLLLGDVQLRRGDLVAARAALDRSLEMRSSLFDPEHPDVGESLYHLACVAAEAGDREAAFELLERAFSGRYRNAELATEPALVSLRGEARFEALVARLGSVP